MEATSPRKMPRQERAKATVRAILDAAAHILVTEGFEAFSTNHIARRAGVSVGSLYQYFPRKEAIIAALLDEHVVKMVGLLAESVAALASLPVHEAVRTYIRATLAVHVRDHELHRALIYALPAVYSTEDVLQIHRRAVPLVAAYLEDKKDEIAVKDRTLAAYLLVTTVEAATHTAALEFPEKLKDGSLERELTTLITRYLGVDEKRAVRGAARRA